MTIKACSPAPPNVSKHSTTGGDGDPSIGYAVMSKKLWPPEKQLLIYFLDGQEKQKLAVQETVKTWQQYANIDFQFTDNPALSNIRISFSLPGSWSAVGIGATLITDITQPTMNLGWIENKNPPSTEDRGTILHEFGHALGMMHEHQSPARGECIHLKIPAVYKYYRPLLGNDDKLVKSQIIDEYSLSAVSNFSKVDLNSIMMYFMPGELNEEGIDIPVNTELSELDKAFITLNYPRKVADPKGMSVKKALEIAGVHDKDASSKILDLVDKEEYKDARDAFISYNMDNIRLHSVNKSFLNAADPSEGQQFGIQDSISSIISNPLFRSVIKYTVNQALARRAIPVVKSVPEPSQKGVLDVIASLITNPSFAKSVQGMSCELSGYELKSDNKSTTRTISEPDKLQAVIKLADDPNDTGIPIGGDLFRLLLEQAKKEGKYQVTQADALTFGLDEKPNGVGTPPGDMTKPDLEKAKAEGEYKGDQAAPQVE